MFGFNSPDVQGRLVALIGALVFSTIFVGAAVGPVEPSQFASIVEAPATVTAHV